MMEGEFSFTEDEVRAQLASLGYRNVSPAKLEHFMKDLQALIDSEKEAEHASYREPYSDLLSPSSSVHSRTADYETNERILSVRTDTKTSHGKAKPPVVKVTGKENQPFSTSHSRQPPNSGVPTLFEERENPDLSAGESSSSLLNSTAGSQSRVRRKVARKRNGKTYVLDESSHDSSESSDITVLEERLRSLPIRDIGRRHSDGTLSYGSRQQEAYLPLPAFIRPCTVSPHEKGIKKCDPVARYHQFKSEWDSFKPPGENSRSNLRWFIRGQMLNHESFQRSQQQKAPSSYVASIEKKR